MDWLDLLAVQGTLKSLLQHHSSKASILRSSAFFGGSDGKASVYNAGDLGSIPGLGRSPGEGKGYPLQNSGLENPIDYSPWGRKESDMTERLHFHFSFSHPFMTTGKTITLARWAFVGKAMSLLFNMLSRLVIIFLPKSTATATAKSLQSCPTLCDPIDGSPLGSSVPGILQARILEWVAISFSNACK